MLVAFEGIDGSGKTTVMRRVARLLRAKGRTVVLTQEPTRTWLGRALRRGIRSRLDPLALACLFLADRASHVKQLAPRGRSTVVLTDRYRDSTTAYQAVALEGRVPRPLVFFAKLQDAWFPAPDLAFLLDVPVEVGLARIHGRRTKEPFEKLRFLRRVRANYLRLAREGRLTVIDATRPASVVADEIARAVLRHAR